MTEEKNYHSQTIKNLFLKFKTSKKGLTSKEASKKLLHNGKNIIKKTKKFEPLKILLEQFKSFLIYILIIAAIISFLVNNKTDGVVISIIILLNAGIGFFQQYKAEKALETLKKFLIKKSKVLRDNKIIEINSQEIVVGDILIFEAGDKINADCRIIESENLQTNEAVLTGESLPVDKFEKKLSEKTILAKRKNMLFTGTQVVRGTATALVISTGMKTEFGKIAETIQKIKIQKTPMQKRLDKFSKQIGIFILIFVGVVMLLGLLEHFDSFEMFMTAIALAVSAIPEGLPAVLAIAFSISSLTMSKQNVIVKKLPAIETLGSVTIICSDKTGTLTEEKMSVQEIFSNNNFYLKKGKELFFKNKKINLKENKGIFQLLKTSILCNNARFEKIKDKYEIIGDPTEQALVYASLDFGLNKRLMIEKQPSLKKFEFDSDRKMMSVLRKNKNKNTLYSKGAIEKILSVSKLELVNGKIKNLTEKRKKEILKNSHKMEKQGLRVLGFAYKNISLINKVKENNLIFLGFVGMIDAPRKEVKQAIKLCREAGIKIKMITGDSVVTANAIAKQIGIFGRTITEKELQKISDEELLKQIEDIGIFARTTPNQKLRITKLLQQKGEVVAITGDGVNDSLALKSADIGVAMGIRGTDVAREVSDIVLIDDNFASLVEGVKQGRKTYDNIKKFVKYMLSVNFSGIILILFSLFMASMFGSEKWILPLLPLQILWVNLITDSFPALALVMEKQDDVMNTKPRKEKSLLEGIWKFIIVAGIFTVMMKISIYIFGVLNSFPEEKTRTMILTTVVLFEMFFVYTCRSNKSIFKIGIFSNKWLNYAVLFSIILHLVLIYTPLANFFGVVPLTLKNWLLILPFAFSGLIVFEIYKLIKRKN